MRIRIPPYPEREEGGNAHPETLEERWKHLVLGKKQPAHPSQKASPYSTLVLVENAP
jgi:hypothetical protein